MQQSRLGTPTGSSSQSAAKWSNLCHPVRITPPRAEEEPARRWRQDTWLDTCCGMEGILAQLDVAPLNAVAAHTVPKEDLRES
jgi:hypothetical protein